MRLGIRATTFSLNMIGIQALTGAYLQQGYFAQEIAEYDLHNYWSYMLILTIVGMTLVTYVSEIKRALTALQLKDSALNAAANSIIITDVTGRIEWANQAFSRLTGFSLNEIYHHNHNDLVTLEKHNKAYYQSMLDSILARKVWHGEFVNCRKDGSLYDEEMTITPLTDNKGNLTHFVAVKQDITERKQTEIALSKSHQLMYLLLNSMAEGTYGVDNHGNCTFVNQSFLRILGYDHTDEIVGKHLHQLIHHSHPNGEHYPTEDCKIYSAYRWNKQVHVSDEVFWRKDGSAVLVEYWSQPLIADGAILGAIVTFIDITKRKQTENELRIAAVAFETQESMMITDANNVILRVNQAFTKTTGYTAIDVVGQSSHLLKSGRHDNDFYNAMLDSVYRTGSWQGEVWDRRKNGEVYPKWLNISAVVGENKVINHYVSTFIDITERKAADEEIKYLAFFDPLTNLPNRRLLLDRLGHALASSARTGRKGALLFIDMDNFKNLNDSLGHEMGDLLLQQVALRLQSCMGEGVVVARLGGDEFVVILEDLSEHILEAATQTEDIGEKILADLNRPYLLVSHIYHSTPSIGATLFNNYEQPIDELLKQADIAMYQAKSQGRNTLCFFDPQMQACITTRVGLEADLRLALAGNQFKLYYQLQTGTQGQTIGAEVLIRWQHPERGMVSPADFIPLAEETGLILAIGQWVLETACAQIKKWENDISTQHLQLAVNVSAKQFCQTDFVQQVQQVLNESGIKPHLLKLELTESMLLTNVAEIIQKMNELREIGVCFSLDDFGTGYSSLAYLTRLPLDQLKIDQSFVRNIGVKSSDAVIVQTIIGMANNLRIEVIAEGVETEAQRVFLEEHGCTRCQGYLFSKPVPLAEFESIIKEKSAANQNRDASF
jgi:diguanylate cyclase (GGDEF)-like protein/PAS domain S-box-containing protein